MPFLDLGAINGRQRERLLGAVAEVIDSGWFVRGRATQRFEQEFAAFVAADHCVGVGNGLDAITLALRALGIGPGDEVLVPSHTFIATWLAVSSVGATPVGVDPDPLSMLVEPEALLAAATPRTRAVMPVDLYGIPCDIPAIVAMARERGWSVVEDAAQAHGASVGGRPIGSLADVTAWSFYPGKNLGALGDAGCITTNDLALAERVRLLGNYGSRVKYEHEVAGVNSRLDEIQAAVLSVKLQSLGAENARRAEIAGHYLVGVSHPDLVLPHVPVGRTAVWHLFPVRAPERDSLARHLKRHEVETLIHYPTPPSRSAAYASAGLEFPVAERLAESLLSLPIGPHLTDDQVAHVINVLNVWEP